jgi:O-acetyl-ADP-ribose deacetylase (regulator of RNase III)
MNNQVVLEKVLSNDLSLQLVQGDITQEPVDAIVNAANERLQHGGGVAAAIANAGGPTIQQQSNAWVDQHGPISHSNPAITDGGNLPSQFVIHVVGPRWGEGEEPEKLRRAILGALRMAEEHDCRSLSLPAISTGIFGYPVDQAAHVILSALQGYQPADDDPTLKKVRITIIDKATLDPFRSILMKGETDGEAAG